MNVWELQDAYGLPPLVDSATDDDSFEQVREFHEVFGHPVSDKPTELSQERLALRLRLIQEEFAELLEASGYEYASGIVVGLELDTPDYYHMDVIEVADALGDLTYVINGMALECGIPLPKVVTEIHLSNMSKLDADGNPIYREDGKVLKSDMFREPDIASVLW